MNGIAQTEAASRARGRARGLWWKGLCGVWMAALILAVFGWLGPAVNTEGQPMFTAGGHGAKAIFFHVPCAWLTFIAFLVGAFYAARHLLRGARPHAGLDDLKSATAMELGLLFSVLATVTGSLFSRNEWGAFWSWDPRQTSILVVLLILAAYGVLRGSVSDPSTRARLSSVYAVVALVPAFFLIWVLPRVMATLHEGPNQTIVGGMIGGNYRAVLYALALPAFLSLFVWLFQIRLRLLRLEERAAQGS